MKREEMRSLLMKSTEQVVARDGLERTTTKSIASGVGVNEVYIYRNFQDKDDLIRQAFLVEDCAFINEMINRTSVLKTEGVTREMSFRRYWDICWNYLMRRPENCLFYVRFYYSAAFDETVGKLHSSYCNALEEEVNGALGNSEILHVILPQILEMMWIFASKVALGTWENTPETAEKCYQILYGMCRGAAG